MNLPSISPSLPVMPSLPGFPPLPGPPGQGMMIVEKVKPKKQPKIPMKACNYMVLSYDKITNTVW